MQIPKGFYQSINNAGIVEVIDTAICYLSCEYYI